jgi:pimeloyl-ACP methyl ester carboxylesterase
VGPDALGVYDAMVSAAGGRPIFIHAGSFGTTAALCVAARRPGVSGMVLQNPPPLRQLILGRYGWWNLWLFAGPVAMQVPSDLDSLENAKHVSTRAVFILAGRDNVVPPPYQHRVVDAYAGEKRVIEMPWAGHDDPLTKEAAEAFASNLDWLWNSAIEKQPQR